MNMMNKCGKIHKDSLSDKKGKINLPSTIELSETANVCTTLYRKLMQAGNFSLEFFIEIFTEDASQILLHHGAKK